MQDADRELAVCPCGKEGQLHTGLYLQLGRQQVKRRVIPLYLVLGRSRLAYSAQLLVSPA